MTAAAAAAAKNKATKTKNKSIGLYANATLLVDGVSTSVVVPDVTRAAIAKLEDTEKNQSSKKKSTEAVSRKSGVALLLLVCPALLWIWTLTY